MTGDLLQPGWRGRRIPINGLNLHVVDAGREGDPVLILLHGFPEFWWAWRGQIAPLVEAGFHVVAPDMRGYNLSDAPDELSAYRLDILADDVAALGAAFGADRFDLVGHDWGGVVAWAVAGRHPERLRRLVVMDAPNPDV
jgi:pimeloyl-ACP methyl ester carboxylesterase